jgi:hypothetical protein
MKMPALMMPKNAVTASNMASILKAQRLDLTACSDAQSKEFRAAPNFANRLMFCCNRSAPRAPPIVNASAFWTECLTGLASIASASRRRRAA